jgi:hypothetical protein
MVGFYTLQEFQGYKVCNFWTSGLISIDFISCSKFERDLNLFDYRQAMWRYLIGGYQFGWIKLLAVGLKDGWMALISPYPFRLSDLILSRGLGSDGWRGRGRGNLTG